jgi:hypothetical protein
MAGRLPAGTLPGMLSFQGLVYAVLFYAALALTAWALVDALIRPAAGYVAAGKLTKPGWAAILGLAVLVIVVFQTPLSFLGLPAVIAAIVYLVDVRPAVRGLSRGGSNW